MYPISIANLGRQALARSEAHSTHAAQASWSAQVPFALLTLAVLALAWLA